MVGIDQPGARRSVVTARHMVITEVQKSVSLGQKFSYCKLVDISI